MRNMCVVAAIVLLVLCGCESKPQKVEGSMTLPDIAAAAVVIKHKISQDSGIKPEERWKYIAFAVAPRLQALGFTDAQTERFAKDIVNAGPYASLDEEIKAVRARYAKVSGPNQIR